MPHNIQEEVFEVNTSYYGYSPRSGAFGYFSDIKFGFTQEDKSKKQTLFFEKCRELFASDCSPYHQTFLYVFNFHDTNPVPFAEFIYKFEESLGVEHIKFYKVKTSNAENLNKALIFSIVPQFWKNPMRFSLLTAIYRSASKSHPGDSEDAVYDADEYTKTTKPAIHLFQSGRTCYTGITDGAFTGWYAKFKNVINPEILYRELVTEKEFETLKALQAPSKTPEQIAADVWNAPPTTPLENRSPTSDPFKDRLNPNIANTSVSG